MNKVYKKTSYIPRQWKRVCLYESFLRCNYVLNQLTFFSFSKKSLNMYITKKTKFFFPFCSILLVFTYGSS